MSSINEGANESSFELLQLDPSPVEELSPSAEKDSYFLVAKSSQTPASSFLGLRSHSLSWWFIKTQYFTTYPITAFAVLHITNTSIIPLATQSVPAADTYLLLTRPFYQSYPLEILFLGLPAALHIVSGIGLRLLRGRRALRNAGIDSQHAKEASVGSLLKRKALPRLSYTSALGYGMAPLLAAHLVLTRVLPNKAKVPNVDLSYIAHFVSQKPLAGFVSLGALITISVSHMCLGWTKWLALSPSVASARTTGLSEDKRRAERRRWWNITMVSALTTGVWIAGGLGVVARAGKAVGWQGRNYDKIINGS